MTVRLPSQFLQQRLGLLQIGSVKALGEPANEYLSDLPAVLEDVEISRIDLSVRGQRKRRLSKRRNVRPVHVGVFLAAQAHCPNTRRRYRLPFRVRPFRRLPALALWPGDTPAHDAKRVAEPKRRLSAPISAMLSRAVIACMPGMLWRCSS